LDFGKMTRRDRLTLFFLLLTITASVFTAVGTLNYMQFYPALLKLQLNLTNLEWATSTDQLEARAIFVLTNPTSYSPLVMKAFEGEFDIQLNGNTTIPQGSFPSARTLPLQPGVLNTITISFEGTAEAARQVATAQATGEEVKFLFIIDIVLSTFLDKMTGISLSYVCEASRGPGSCKQEAFVFSIWPDQASAGGGGGGGV